MDKEQLHSTLGKLRTELDQPGTVSDDARERLHQIDADIQELLKREGDHQGYDQVGKRMKDEIAQMEASHPNITLLMGQIADMLAKIGI